MTEALHKPVMLGEVLSYLAPKDGEVIVDATFGAGGYSKAILDAADCKLYGIDRDPNVVETAKELKQKYGSRFEFLSGRFAQIKDLLELAGVKEVSAIVMDIGTSSMQLDQAWRGFSFMHDGPLDMRMSGAGKTAADFVNNASQEELADTIYRYGDEKKSRYIAKAILRAREKAAITTTFQLAEIVRSAIHGKRGKIDPATRTFQAIRIWVNNELDELQEAVKSSCTMLAPGGRLVVVSFHSLEDKIVKDFFNKTIGKVSGISRHHITIPGLANTNAVTSAGFKLLNNKVVVPTDEEVDSNPRARSARLRGIKRLS